MKMNFKRRPSTSNAIKAITTALDELDAVVAIENAEIERLDAEITAIATKRMETFSRRDHAAVIAKRFADLVTV